ncbi:hypothetical protein CAMRE0001_1464 [Campylobacter rectus RM3267]|uniref:Uncharacterized protein n=1 Tax=Campylobacter rectus RM3267 TaxID=553218 RepID=B9D330_CAMRE|nr:hypothetical protein CAMRE0001_1464 [Campylobacter rectus RM3267]
MLHLCLFSQIECVLSVANEVKLSTRPLTLGFKVAFIYFKTSENGAAGRFI